MSNRIAKHVWKDETWERSTYYLLDAQGNQVSIYEHNPDAPTVEFNLVENNIYGSSRVGSFHREIDLLTTSYSNNYTTFLGYKNYEFTNHLGNVLTVFNDKKIPQDEDNNGKVDGYVIGIFSTADYSPFGVELDGRSMRSEGYRYGFNSMEKDDEVKGGGNSYDFGARMYDSRVGRWWSVDKHERNYCSMNPYNFGGLNPIRILDFDGNEIIVSEEFNKEKGKNQITITLTGKVVFDFLSQTKSPNEQQRYVDNLNSALIDFYTKSYSDFDVIFKSELTIGTMKDVKDEDHVVYSMNLHTGKEAVGFNSDAGGFVNGIGGKKAFFPFNSRDFTTPIHEVGHWLGLHHPEKIAEMISIYGIPTDEIDKEPFKFSYDQVMGLFSKDNIMLKQGGKSSLNEIQVDIIKMMYFFGGLNQGSNEKKGNIKFEFEGAFSNPKANLINRKIVGNELENEE